MTDSDKREVIETLHQLELRMVEKFARMETEIRQWRSDGERLSRADKELAGSLQNLRNDFEVEKQVFRDRSNRLVIAMAVVALIAMGNMFTKAVPLFF